MWQTSFYLFGSIGIVWSLIWISLYSEKDCEKNDELPLIIMPQVRLSVLLVVQNLNLGSIYNKIFYLIFRVLI